MNPATLSPRDHAGPASVAVLDMDGTLLQGFLASVMTEELRTIRGADEGAARAALGSIARYKAGDITDDDCAEAFYPAYGRAVRSLHVDVLQELGARVWRRCQERLFAYARPLVELLRARGFVTCLISGSPSEAVAVASANLDIDRCWGTAVRIRDGRATGDLVRTPALRGGKAAVLDIIDREVRVDWDASFAIGDSASDIEVLSRVAMPIAFEPDPLLQRRALREGWNVADRDTALDCCRELLRQRPS